MKKLLTFALAAIFVIIAFTMDASAAKKSSKKMSAEAMDEINLTIDNLTKKVYGRALLSPEDNQKLIDVKIQLDNQMLSSPDVSLAPLYYKAGYLYKMREMKQESVECFQTILENFADTALAPKARTSLRAMGIEVAEPVKASDDEEEE
ncbi:MAG: hypothetical protein ACI37S_01480 [Candidatus Gastranaerophilaceae bacterium]